jgi:hypothetical protein
MDGGRPTAYTRTLEKSHNDNAASWWGFIMWINIIICTICIIVGFSFLIVGDERGSTYSATWVTATVTGILTVLSYLMMISIPN